jgi:hypothetical protein
MLQLLLGVSEEHNLIELSSRGDVAAVAQLLEAHPEKALIYLFVHRLCAQRANSVRNCKDLKDATKK